MARDAEVLLLGGLGSVVQSDAVENFNSSAEVGVRMRIMTKRYALLSPAGDVVAKRMFIQAEHKRGVSFEATPVVDTERVFQMRRHFHRPPVAGDPTRVSFLMPVARIHDDGGYSAGVRGSTFACEITAYMPESEFNIESLQIEAHTLQVARGRDQKDT